MSILARLFGRQAKPQAFIEINNTFNSFSGTGYNSAAFRAAVDAIAQIQGVKTDGFYTNKGPKIHLR